MTTGIRLAAAAIAVIAVVSAGIILLRPTSPGVSQATTTPTRTPAASTPEPTIPGRVTLFDSEPNPIGRITITVPAGWTLMGTGAIEKNVESRDAHGTQGPRAMFILPSYARFVVGDPCHWRDTQRDPGPSVDDLANAFAAVDERNPSTLQDISVDGYVGTYLTWSVPDSADFSECDPYYGTPQYGSWLTVKDDGLRYQQAPGQVDMLWVLDVDGDRIIIDASYMPGATSADIAELRQIVQSADFDRPPG